MNLVTKVCLGFSIPIGYYASLEEADAVASKPGAMLEEANNNLYYRGAAGEARAIVAKAVEKLTSITRETKAVTKKVKKIVDGKETEVEEPLIRDGQPVTEFVLDDEDYVNLALGQWVKSGRTKDELNDGVLAAIRAANDGKGVSVDIKAKVRNTPTPKVLAQKFLDAAKASIANGKVMQFAKDYKKLLGKDLTSTSDPVVVGWGLKEFLTARENALLANQS